MSFAASNPTPDFTFDAKSEPSAAATRLATVGTLLFGARFHAALANELKISRPLVFAMVNGQRRVTPEIETRLAATIRSRIVPRLESKIEALPSIAETIDDKMSAYRPTRLDEPVEPSAPGRAA